MAAQPQDLSRLLAAMTQQGGLGTPMGPQPLPTTPPEEMNLAVPGLDPELSPVQSEAYQIDPLVLNRPVRIRIDGSTRMLSRAALQQDVGMLAQFILNGPFLQALGANGDTVDFTEFARMLQDATGITRSYRLFRRLTPQEQQARQQPSPDAQMKMQAAQLEAQTRTQIMQMKQQGESARLQVESALKDKAIDEESARYLLGLIAKEREGGGQAKAQEGQQKLALQAAQGQQKLRQDAQSHVLKLRQQQQELAVRGAEGQQKLRTSAAMDQQKLLSTLIQGRAKAQAAKEGNNASRR